MTPYIASKMASFTLLILITSLPSRAREPFCTPYLFQGCFIAQPWHTSSRVEPPNHQTRISYPWTPFWYFSHFLTNLSNFCVIGLHKLKGYKCSFSFTSKGATQKKHRKEEKWVIVCFKIFEKISSTPLSSSSPHVFLIFSPFWMI